MKRQPAAIGLIAAVVVSGMLQAAAATPAAFSYRNPFNPEQCDRAIAAGKKRRARDPSSPQSRLLLAEGLLCKGLQDDPGALDAAIDLLRPIVAQQPSNFFAQLDLADALRKRFPLSDEAESLLWRTSNVLRVTDVGAARQELARYLDENLAAIEQQRMRTLPLVRSRSAALGAGTALSAADMGSFLILLMATGPEGLAQAQQTLEAYLKVHQDSTLATLYRAEILWALGESDRCPALYREAAAILCHDGTPPSSACGLARWRLEQLQERPMHDTSEAANENKGGMTWP